MVLPLDTPYRPTHSTLTYPGNTMCARPWLHDSLQSGDTRHALTRALNTRHATARVTMSAPNGEPHTVVRIIARTHTQTQISPPCAIVAASTSHERVGEPRARKERNLGVLLNENLRFECAQESSRAGS